MHQTQTRPSFTDLWQLKRWNTPTLYNGWEQITRHDPTRDGINLEEVRDFMPQMPPLVGFAVTLVIEPSNPKHAQGDRDTWSEYRRYIAEQPGPKVAVVQDLDKPATIGAVFGEVNSNIHKSLGCNGVIVDGAVRDVEEMFGVGFKALARRLAVGHGYGVPVSWGEPVEVFGQRVEPGQLIHGDKHGFLAVTFEDEARLLEAARFMDEQECETVIRAGHRTEGMSKLEICDAIDAAGRRFGDLAKAKFGGDGGEW